MGMFDTVEVSDIRFCCSEGHDLSGESFQTKDLNECMLEWSIENGCLVHPPEGSDGWGILPQRPFTGSIHIYTDCRQCPAFVQAGTMNLVPCSVDFDVAIDKDLVVHVLRSSPDTKDFLIDEPNQPWMKGCLGPMPYEEARQLHVNSYRNRK